LYGCHGELRSPPCSKEDGCEVVGGACLLSVVGAELAATAAAAAAAATAAANGFAAPCPPSYHGEGG